MADKGPKSPKQRRKVVGESKGQCWRGLLYGAICIGLAILLIRVDVSNEEDEETITTTVEFSLRFFRSPKNSTATTTSNSTAESDLLNNQPVIQGSEDDGGTPEASEDIEERPEDLVKAPQAIPEVLNRAAAKGCSSFQYKHAYPELQKPLLYKFPQDGSVLQCQNRCILDTSCYIYIYFERSHKVQRMKRRCYTMSMAESVEHGKQDHSSWATADSTISGICSFQNSTVEATNN